MAATQPAGPRPHLVGGFLLGLGLLLWGVMLHPGLHSIWQVPLGAYLVILCIGKAASR